MLKLTQGQLALLELLLESENGFALQQIATKLGVTRQHVESSTRNLESRGLVEIERVGTGENAFLASPGPLLRAVRGIDPSEIVERGRSRQSR